MSKPKKSWISKLLGDNAKMVGVDRSPKDNTDETYEVAWRNKFLAARIGYLNNVISKKKTRDIAEPVHFNLPENVQIGSIERLKSSNENLTERVKYLEKYVQINFPKIKLKNLLK